MELALKTAAGEQLGDGEAKSLLEASVALEAKLAGEATKVAGELRAAEEKHTAAKGEAKALAGEVQKLKKTGADPGVVQATKIGVIEESDSRQ